MQATPLHIAAGYGHKGLVRWLIFAGVNAKAQNITGMDALALAEAKGHSKVVAFLSKKSIMRLQAHDKFRLCQTKTTLRCQHCKKAAFCSRVCLKAGWKVHKRTCRAVLDK
mmetsp:Transcript_3957/g.5493  ORF Transcript_3957/g.5493 Transcript_3957/m.5493 type:complete len:111 (+) Transcript_3957:22-354(+)